MPEIVKAPEVPSKQEVQEYVPLSGRHYTRDEKGNELRWKPGELVPLTETQYESFKDKFEDPESYAARSAKAKAAAKVSSTPSKAGVANVGTK